jgi:hypothetical protein
LSAYWVTSALVKKNRPAMHGGLDRRVARERPDRAGAPRYPANLSLRGRSGSSWGCLAVRVPTPFDLRLNELLTQRQPTPNCRSVEVWSRRRGIDGGRTTGRKGKEDRAGRRRLGNARGRIRLALPSQPDCGPLLVGPSWLLAAQTATSDRMVERTETWAKCGVERRTGSVAGAPA